MYLNKFLVIFILSISFVYSVDTIGININQADIELTSSVEINKPKSKKKPDVKYYTQYLVATNLPKAKKKSKNYTKYLIDSYYIHSGGKNLFSIGISGNNKFYNSDVISFGFGIKSVLAQDTLALPFYGKAILSVPHRNGGFLPTVSISAMLAYAPSILSMIESTEYKEVRGEADIEIIPKIHLFGGYRKIDIKYKTFDSVFNDSVYAGMKFNF